MRGNTLEALRRGYLALTRGTLVKAHDEHMLQTHDVKVMHNETLEGVEHFQTFGFHSVPLPPDKQTKKAAEVIIGFMNGHRSHPVVLSVNDRRTKPKNWKEGEVGLWHNKGATAKFTQDGSWKHDAGSEKKPFVIQVDNAVVTVASGKITCQVGGDGGPAVVVKTDFVYLGGDPDNGGTFAFVETVSGPSNKAKARIA